MESTVVAAARAAIAATLYAAKELCGPTRHRVDIAVWPIARQEVGVHQQENEVIAAVGAGVAIQG